MSAMDNLLNDLVIANRILANEDVVDAYGHVSVRHPDRSDRFFLARSLAPEFITRKDIIEFNLDGTPVNEEKRAVYLEQSIELKMSCAFEPANTVRPPFEPGVALGLGGNNRFRSRAVC